MSQADVTIAQTGAKPVGANKDAEEKARVIKSDESVGYWFAESISHELNASFKGWLPYIAKAWVMTPAARKAAVNRLASIVKEIRDHAKAQPEGIDRERATKTANSAVVMLSNFRTILKAFNAGMDLEIRKDEMGNILHDKNNQVIPVNPMTAIIAEARVFVLTHAADGKEKGERGRPAKAWLDALKGLVARRDESDKTKVSPDDCKAAAEFFTALASVKANAKATPLMPAD